MNTHGALSLNPLNTSDPDAAQRFYSDLFGWRTEQGVRHRDGLLGHIPRRAAERRHDAAAPGAPAPSHWLVYFGIDDVDGAAEQIGSAGGTVMIPPQDVPGGRILVGQDPQGAVFAVFTGRFDN